MSEKKSENFLFENHDYRLINELIEIQETQLIVILRQVSQFLVTVDFKSDLSDYFNSIFGIFDLFSSFKGNKESICGKFGKLNIVDNSLCCI